MEEIIEALDAIVRSGKVRYLGASSMYAWQFQKLLHLAQDAGLHQFISMQNYVNLIYREEEREMLPLCADAGIAVMPWSPLARGKLARPADGASTQRSQTDRLQSVLYDQTQDADAKVISEVERIAGSRGVPMAQIALAWVLQKPAVTSPVIGATKAGHIDDAVAALDLKLTPEEIAALEKPYVPHEVTGLFTMPPGDLKLTIKL